MRRLAGLVHRHWWLLGRGPRRRVPCCNRILEGLEKFGCLLLVGILTRRNHVCRGWLNIICMFRCLSVPPHQVFQRTGPRCAWSLHCTPTLGIIDHGSNIKWVRDIGCLRRDGCNHHGCGWWRNCVENQGWPRPRKPFNSGNLSSCSRTYLRLPLASGSTDFWDTGLGTDFPNYFSNSASF